MDPGLVGWQILTTVVLLGGELVYGLDCWLDQSWARTLNELRSRTSDGSEDAGSSSDPQAALSARAGVEHRVPSPAPPAHPRPLPATLTPIPRQRVSGRHLSPVDAINPATRPPGPDSASAGGSAPALIPALAGLDTGRLM